MLYNFGQVFLRQDKQSKDHHTDLQYSCFSRFRIFSIPTIFFQNSSMRLLPFKKSYRTVLFAPPYSMNYRLTESTDLFFECKCGHDTYNQYGGGLVACRLLLFVSVLGTSAVVYKMKAICHTNDFSQTSHPADNFPQTLKSSAQMKVCSTSSVLNRSEYSHGKLDTVLI